jgi:aryl-alcohol dehydrogenase-like predicted oxidoreductase
MEQRQLGRSDVMVPPIVFGAWAIGGWMWGGTDDDDAIAAIRAAIDAGMNAIDTAPIYGYGHSEEVVGKAIKGRRDEVVIATKCGLRWDFDDGEFFFPSTDAEGNKTAIYRVLKADAIIEECERSLVRLGTDVIDLYQCHWSDNTTPVEETWEAMTKLVDQGKVRAAGVSNFTTEDMQTCMDIGLLTSNQPPYSLLNRNIEEGVLPFCIENNIGVLAYSPLQNGILTGKVTMDRTFSEDDLRSGSPWYKPANRCRVLDALETIQPIADGYSVTLAQLVINWTIGEPGITVALVGARNPAQAKENAAAAGFTITASERATIRKTFEALGDPQ